MFSTKTHYTLPKDLQKIVIEYLEVKETDKKNDIPLYCTKFVAGLLVMIPLFNASIEKNLQPQPNRLKITGYLALTFMGMLVTIPSVCITLPIDTLIDSSKKISNSAKNKQAENWASFFIDIDPSAPVNQIVNSQQKTF